MRCVSLFVLWLVLLLVPAGVFGGEEDDRVFRFTLTPWTEPGLSAPEAIGGSLVAMTGLPEAR